MHARPDKPVCLGDRTAEYMLDASAVIVALVAVLLLDRGRELVAAREKVR